VFKVVPEKRKVSSYKPHPARLRIHKLVTHRCTDFGMEKNKIMTDGVISGYGK
jgi:acetyl-CoA carboxylase carboxyltransferase component